MANAPEGGAVVTRDGNLFERLLQTRTHGMSAAAVDRYYRDRYRHWDMARLGTKANLPDLLAALLPEQIDTIRDRLPAREAMAQRYREALTDGPARLVAPVSGGRSAEHLFPVHLPPPVRDDAIAALNKAGIGVAVHYRPVPAASYYRETHGLDPLDWPVSYEWGGGTLSLPLYEALTVEQQSAVIAAMKDHVYPLCAAVAG
ncbi:MAG: DegT/DnrJ/EryC1/StrS family aminotransferase [Pseudomonadota bacterium]